MSKRKGRQDSQLAVVPGVVSLSNAHGKDLSGLEIAPTQVKGGNFFEAIFNGCRMNGIQAHQSVFQHTEFTEASITDSAFEDTSFDHSDFVLSTISNTVFVRCSFQNAEWRDAKFENVQFRQCIFRNTTVSLVHFRSCQFDDASAANLVGPSKRFCLFSSTDFRLPAGDVEFLRTNFGIVGGPEIDGSEDADGDPLFELSRRHYAGHLTEHEFYRLVMVGFEQIANSRPNSERLRLRYLIEICRIAIQERLFSVFAIRLLERTLTKRFEKVRGTEEKLLLFGLIAILRMESSERRAAIERELDSVPEVAPADVEFAFEFENTYSEKPIRTYLRQLASFAGLRATQLRVRSIRQGSTLVDAILTAAASFREAVRFVRYSISSATVVLGEVKKVQKDYRKLGNGSKAPSRKTTASAAKRVRRADTKTTDRTRIDAVVGTDSRESQQIDIFVDQAKEQVFIVGGRVRVTVSYVAP